MLLYDKFDVWQVPLDGGKETNLTAGVGKAQGIQFRVVRFERVAVAVDEAAVVDGEVPVQPRTLTAWTWRSRSRSPRTATARRSSATGR